MATLYYETAVQEDLDTGTGAVSKRAPGGGTQTGTQISLSTFAQNQLAATVAWDVGSITSGSFASKDITVSGAALGDMVLRSLSLDVKDLQLDAQVTSANTVTATLYNLTGGALDIGTPTLKVLVFKVK
jgi:hypothetical protein